MNCGWDSRRLPWFVQPPAKANKSFNFLNPFQAEGKARGETLTPCKGCYTLVISHHERSHILPNFRSLFFITDSSEAASCDLLAKKTSRSPENSLLQKNAWFVSTKKA